MGFIILAGLIIWFLHFHAEKRKDKNIKGEGKGILHGEEKKCGNTFISCG
jgi:hypothetical protein